MSTKTYLISGSCDCAQDDGFVGFCIITKYHNGLPSFSNSLMNTANARSMTGSKHPCSDVLDKRSAIQDLFKLAQCFYAEIPDNCFAISGTSEGEAISGTSEFLGAQFLRSRKVRAIGEAIGVFKNPR
jgi:hypothetical protein